MNNIGLQKGGEGGRGQSVGPLTRKSGGSGFDTRSGNILSFLLPLFQEGQLSVTGENQKLSFSCYHTVYGVMTCDSTSFLAFFQSWLDNGWLLMKGCVQWNPVNH